ncbi:MAG: hypothetical protein J1E83_06790 [Lachnospiraceae bacterium]|nr:hypothetical protein [Lachnospiraceae bacterium]
MIKKAAKKINQTILWLDNAPLWGFFFLLFLIVFLLFPILREGSVFEYHDQLDEYMMNTVLTARHLGEGLEVLPEMMGGINASGLQPAGVLFVPLFCVLPAFWAFVLQYAIVFAAGFFGMYLCVKEMTESSVLALMAAGCFCMLPLYPIYGLSEMGIPLVLYSFIKLWKGAKPWTCLLMLLFFALASHLVYTGYTVLGLWAVGLLISLFRKRKSGWLAAAFFLLLAVYILENYHLFAELFLGGSNYVSHREEMVTYAMPFFQTVWDVFVSSAQHAPSLHKYLIIPIAAILAAGGFLIKNMSQEMRVIYYKALGGALFLIGIALFYGICKWQPIVDIKNDLSGFLHYFQIERLYWLYPAGWYLEMALCFSLLWKLKANGRRAVLINAPLLKLAVIFMLLCPTLLLIAKRSVFYMNFSQYMKGSGNTGYISWESYYAEDLMQELEDVIGRDISTYRIANLGISPSPSLMHGFYTVDGYSNNYSLDYKHAFRQIIAKELEKDEPTRLYFDNWGNRCYLFNGITGSAWMLGKDSQIVYEKPEFDMEALKALGCEYLFSCGVIENAEELGLSCLGYYETESSYWGIWLYKLQ